MGRVRERGGFDDAVATYTQGLMDLGATVCTRSKPGCEVCPVQPRCMAFQSGRVAQLPTPRPRKVLPEKHSTFLLLLNGSDILLEKRPGSGIWGGLWCPPQFDDESSALAWCDQHGIKPSILHYEQGKCTYAALPIFTHTFTHFKLHIAPLLVQMAHKPRQIQEPGRVWLDVEDALRAAIPSPVRRLIEKIIRGGVL